MFSRYWAPAPSIGIVSNPPETFLSSHVTVPNLVKPCGQRYRGPTFFGGLGPPLLGYGVTDPLETRPRVLRCRILPL